MALGGFAALGGPLLALAAGSFGTASCFVVKPGLAGTTGALVALGTTGAGGAIGRISLDCLGTGTDIFTLAASALIIASAGRPRGRTGRPMVMVNEHFLGIQVGTLNLGQNTLQWNNTLNLARIQVPMFFSDKCHKCR